MGSAIAMREETPLVPNTPQNPNELKVELKQYATDLDVGGRLRAYGNALEAVEEPAVAGADYYLLELDPSIMQISVTPYSRRELDRASTDYLEVEKKIAGSTSDAVLVSVDSMASLRRAYPNYFLDTRRFLETVEEAIN
jgi:hypothetical protein